MTFALGVVPVVLLLIGFPIYVVLLTAVSVALVFFMHVPLAALHQNLFGAIDAFALLAVPFFIYAGELMSRGSVAQRIVDFVQAGVGRVPGSLGVTTVGTSAIFGAISGASAATVATVGRVMLPALRNGGYPERFSAGLITAVGAIYVVWYAKRNGIGAGTRFELKTFWQATKRGIWALGAPFIILGGIYGGVFSPTEAAAVACVYAALVTWAVFRELGWSDVVEAAASTALFTGQVLIIVACASVFAW